jgi:NitT/TauT family transport system ATP-binding protein
VNVKGRSVESGWGLHAGLTPYGVHYNDHAFTEMNAPLPVSLEQLRTGVQAPAIALEGVSKSFATDSRGKVTALSTLDLEIPEGQFVCLVGPSGCGKTTILNLVAGLETASSGVVRVRGQAVKGPGPDRTVMFQDSALFPWLTVQKNVEFPLEVAGVPLAERSERAEHYLRMVHLWKFRGAQPHELSGGMRQRAALARALVIEPKILLMDEPFAALDAQTRDVLHAELERVWLETQKTVVFVTHNVREAVRLGDRVVILGTRPGRLKRVLDVDLARPRDAEQRDVTLLASVVTAELKAEIEKVMREEVDDAWKPASGVVRPRADRNVGGGI